jgi:hypothetical protein
LTPPFLKARLSRWASSSSSCCWLSSCGGTAPTARPSCRSCARAEAGGSRVAPFTSPSSGSRRRACCTAGPESRARGGRPRRYVRVSAAGLADLATAPLGRPGRGARGGRVTSQRRRPPAAVRLLAALFPPKDAAAEAAIGDLEEEYALRAARGTFRAAAWYWAEAASHARRFAAERVRGWNRGRTPAGPVRRGDSTMRKLWGDLRLAFRGVRRHPRVRRRRGRDPGPGHRRQRRPLQRRGRRPLEAVALPRSGPAGDRLGERPPARHGSRRRLGPSTPSRHRCRICTIRAVGKDFWWNSCQKRGREHRGGPLCL